MAEMFAFYIDSATSQYRAYSQDEAPPVPVGLTALRATHSLDSSLRQHRHSSRLRHEYRAFLQGRRILTPGILLPLHLFHYRSSWAPHQGGPSLQRVFQSPGLQCLIKRMQENTIMTQMRNPEFQAATTNPKTPPNKVLMMRSTTRWPSVLNSPPLRWTRDGQLTYYVAPDIKQYVRFEYCVKSM